MTTLFCLLLTLAPAICDVQASDAAEDRGRPLPEDYRDVETDPTVADGIRKYADDGQDGPQRNFGVQAIHDNRTFAVLRADRFEYQSRDGGGETFLWDLQGWIGNDDDKVYLETEGRIRLGGDRHVEEATIDLLYSRNVASFWDLQLGIRHDTDPDPQRSFLAAGFQGLAPYWFEIDATAYLSEDGDLSAAFEAEYELLVTQRLHVIPRLEAGLSLHDVPEYGVWQGVTDVTLGVRLLYQIRRELSPYLGVSCSRALGETGHNIERQGGDVDSFAFVTGLRYWF